MKDRLSVWAQNIAPSPTLAVDAKAKKLKAEGRDAQPAAENRQRPGGLCRQLRVP